MKAIAFCIAAFGIGASGNLTGQSTDVAGTWKLVSASAMSPGTDRNDAAFGPNPRGLLIYTPEGRMTAIISYGNRKRLSGADRIASPPEEQAAAFATFFAYGGRYSVKGNQVIHHVEVSSVENWVNTDLVRIIQLEGDRMTLITPPLSVAGRMRTTELVWQRVR